MLARWDPFREMLQMRRTMDRLIDGSLTENDFGQSEWSLPLDVVEKDNEYVVKASLPGIKPEDIDVTLDKGLLTIKGQVQDESDKEEGQYHLRERRFGMFSRTIQLPTSVNADQIQADYKDGILMLTLPKTEEVKPKKIAIKHADKMVESKLTDGKQKVK